MLLQMLLQMSVPVIACAVALPMLLQMFRCPSDVGLKCTLQMMLQMFRCTSGDIVTFAGENIFTFAALTESLSGAVWDREKRVHRQYTLSL
jgi:hypothetical protein